MIGCRRAGSGPASRHPHPSGLERVLSSSIMVLLFSLLYALFLLSLDKEHHTLVFEFELFRTFDFQV